MATVWVLWPGQPPCAECDTAAVNHSPPLWRHAQAQLIWKCFIPALLNNTTGLLQPPALSSLTLHPPVLCPGVPHHLTQSWCISILCSRPGTAQELTAPGFPRVSHPESCSGQSEPR